MKIDVSYTESYDELFYKYENNILYLTILEV